MGLSPHISAVVSLSIVLGLQLGCNKVQPETASNAAGQPNATEATGEAPIPGNAAPAAASTHTTENASPANTPTPTDADSAQSVSSELPASSGADSKPESAAANSQPIAEAEFQSRPFMTLQENPTNAPEELVQHLTDVDYALQDLVRYGASNMVPEEVYVSAGLRLGRMKLAAGQRLATAAEATTSQVRAGLLAQLVALSHLSGLRDVEAAKELERFAGKLSQTDDPDLAHQSRVVLMGFEVQALQNGLKSDPNALLAQAEGLFARPEDRNFPEFMTLQNAAQVLDQMGFADAAQRVMEILTSEYLNSDDPQLRGQAWALATRDSAAVEEFVTTMNSIGSPQVDLEAIDRGARKLIAAHPNATTLEQISGMIGNVEYNGHLAVSQQLATVVRESMPTIEATEQQRQAIESVVSAHEARGALVGQPLPLNDVVDFSDQPLVWDDFQGKVVLVDFWASWCKPCLQEIPNIRRAYEELHAEGFEVVGVNMDDKFDAAQAIVTQQKLPWRTFHSQDPNAAGFKASFAKQFGINMIPFMLLIDTEGKVAAIHVRGENIIPKVRELLAAAPAQASE
ncbi:TlpA family protein disulfide reductase [Aureliella helgolandensis]|uniref:Thiol-disulfide oxidoreductase ResA n=1 Tax=Aureliella helgolandensis TaxID=2527968 RepID=A0A518GEP7_9BACT|nr:TlpA disulfide reductase family protein [Aureliella helgolandensis]QDV27030.1 Thiol-disulfide oxidoreductase ResA [Aureliella helgolandensis]